MHNPGKIHSLTIHVNQEYSFLIKLKVTDLNRFYRLIIEKVNNSSIKPVNFVINHQRSYNQINLFRHKKTTQVSGICSP